MGDMISQYLVEIFLSAFSGSGGSVKVHLFTAGTPSPLSTAGSFTEPTGTWYSAQSGTAGETYVLPDGTCGVSMGLHQWNYSGSSASETIIGWYTSDSSNSVLYSANLLDNSYVMGQTGDAAFAEPYIEIPQILQTSDNPI